ncbi:hypothetical protein NLJ89_g2018 [Agrocybe chaxingu]|uniref:Peptide hydrolase n=1 Tax=Agrocybe chaxingu TaxID=84603 RepID=A0A9W8K7F3_9AGAR|nr:hypothetical protein NLJ89_g2018 [Agrocybe chaxingu]
MFILKEKKLVTAPLLALIYITVFIRVFLDDDLPDVPEDQDGLNVDQAWSDLHKISTRPHPYNSHENDVVRSYILSRLNDVAVNFAHVHVIDDLTTNVSFVDPPASAYFEGMNILVKVEGSDPAYSETGGVLFSAHFDSVSTSVGATDDGMGTVTCMQLVEYFAKHRPRRTAIFNINNGEEDGLNGAHAQVLRCCPVLVSDMGNRFLNHPWSKIPDTFLNFEGSGTGGRPVFFRATSMAPMLSATSRHVRRPHANVISGDAFQRGFIRSRTDFSVYQGGGHYEGVDLAFYKRRCYYHTKYDSIPFLVGGKKSLWSMLESARGSALTLLNDDELHNDDLKLPAVFFDLFAKYLVVLSKGSLLTANIVVLIASPIVLLCLSVYIRHAPEPHHDVSLLRPFLRAGQSFYRSATTSATAFFWSALGSLFVLEATLVWCFVEINPFAIYSSPYLVLFSFVVLGFLSTQLVAAAARSSTLIRVSHPWSMPRESELLTRLYAFNWILTLIGTVLLYKLQLGGVYFLTVSNVSTFFATVISSVTQPGRARPADKHVAHQGDQSATKEASPSVWRSDRSVPGLGEQNEKVGWSWVAQVMLTVVPSVVLIFHVVVLVLDGMAQTLPDGGNPTLVYTAVAVLSVLLTVPMIPWTFSVHRFANYAVFLAFAAALVYTFAAFPFSPETPLKVFFQQSLALDGGWHIGDRSSGFNSPSHSPQLSLHDAGAGGVKVLTTLVGTPHFLQHAVIPAIPSSVDTLISCVDTPHRSGTVMCKWESGLMPSPVGTKACANPALSLLNFFASKQRKEGTDLDLTSNANPNDWIDASIVRTGPTSARFSVRGTNTKNCRLYFDTRALVAYQVHGADDAVVPTPGYEMPPQGVHELRLFSRTWDRTFVVDVEWKREGHGHGLSGDRDNAAGNDVVAGRIACEWSEYASGRVGTAQENLPGSVIPAYEEILNFAPRWVSVSKLYHGLLEVSGEFSIN